MRRQRTLVFGKGRRVPGGHLSIRRSLLPVVQRRLVNCFQFFSEEQLVILLQHEFPAPTQQQRRENTDLLNTITMYFENLGA